MALPYTGDENAILDTIKRYGVDYIVVVLKDARHEYYDDLEQGIFPSYLEKIHYSETLIIGKIKEGL